MSHIYHLLLIWNQCRIQLANDVQGTSWIHSDYFRCWTHLWLAAAINLFALFFFNIQPGRVQSGKFSAVCTVFTSVQNILSNELLFANTNTWKWRIQTGGNERHFLDCFRWSVLFIGLLNRSKGFLGAAGLGWNSFGFINNPSIQADHTCFSFFPQNSSPWQQED